MKKYVLSMLILVFGFFSLSVFATDEGICNETSETPNSRYTVHSNNTVTDTQTGLMWMTCPMSYSGAENPGCIPSNNYVDRWSVLVDAAENYSFAGHTDWRIPNIKELRTLVDHNCYPHINTDIFPSINGTVIWELSSSTPMPPSILNQNRDDQVWRVNMFQHGLDRGLARATSFHVVRLVRRN